MYMNKIRGKGKNKWGYLQCANNGVSLLCYSIIPLIPFHFLNLATILIICYD